MDENVIAEKLESLRRCIYRIEVTVPATALALRSNLDAQDILILNLERAVQICVDIAAHIVSDLELLAPKTMAGTFAALHEAKLVSAEVSLRMVKAVGFRNIAIHEYRTIDWDIVFNIASSRLGDFRDFAREVASLK